MTDEDIRITVARIDQRLLSIEREVQSKKTPWYTSAALAISSLTLVVSLVINF